MITIILPISRKDYLRAVFNCLAQLERPVDTQLLIMTDGDMELGQAIDHRLDSLLYNRIRVINFGDGAATDRNDRRYRISEIHNKMRHQLDDRTDHVFSIEDDSIYPPDSLLKLLDTFGKYEDCAFVEGVELGRHKSKHLGAWRADNINDPKVITSIEPGEGIEPIDAGGLYCALINADLYRQHHFEPYDKEGNNGLSCDVDFGLSLRRQGYGCYVDHSIQLDHIGDKGSVNLGNTKPIQVIFQKRKNKWESRVKV